MDLHIVSRDYAVLAGASHENISQGPLVTYPPPLKQTPSLSPKLQNLTLVGKKQQVCNERGISENSDHFQLQPEILLKRRG